MTDFLQAHPNGQVIAMDEMSLYVQATTTRLWAACGQTPVVRVSAQRDHVHLYGALNLCNGHEFALPRPEMTSVETADFLRDLFYCYPDQPILLLWDRARWHKGQMVRDLLAHHPRVETLFFPPASPELNPQEHIWSLARTNISHNHALPDLPTLRDTFLHYLATTLFRLTWLTKYAPPLLCNS
ncbi:MAG: IS630 family transposase [Chloroflexota bacterium]|nr:IS630 family transposase [Chloroflexota bacterium]